MNVLHWEELCFRDFMASVIAEARTRTDEALDLQSGILSASCAGAALDVRVDAADASIVHVRSKRPSPAVKAAKSRFPMRRIFPKAACAAAISR